MNLALGMWALLAGGWVFPSSSGDLPSVAPPPSVVGTDAAQPGAQTTPNTAAATKPSSSPLTQYPRTPPMSPLRGNRSGSNYGYGSISTMPRMMPMAPTAPGAGGMVMPMAPTAAAATGYSSAGMGMPSRAARIGAGGYGSGMSPNSFTSMESSHRAAQIGASGNAGNSSMAGGGKAFSNYRPTSAVSPYMNMFRGNDAAGTIDNYTTLVRPQLDAQQQSVMTGNDISALQAQSSQNPLAMPLRPQTQSGTIDGGMGSQNYLNYEQTPNAQQNPAYQQQTPPITP